jgi:hypothetical protein
MLLTPFRQKYPKAPSNSDVFICGVDERVTRSAAAKSGMFSFIHLFGWKAATASSGALMHLHTLVFTITNSHTSF